VYTRITRRHTIPPPIDRNGCPLGPPKAVDVTVGVEFACPCGSHRTTAWLVGAGQGTRERRDLNEESGGDVSLDGPVIAQCGRLVTLKDGQVVDVSPPPPPPEPEPEPPEARPPIPEEPAA